MTRYQQNHQQVNQQYNAGGDFNQTTVKKTGVWDFLSGIWGFLGGAWGFFAAIFVALILGAALFMGVALVVSSVTSAPVAAAPAATSPPTGFGLPTLLPTATMAVPTALPIVLLPTQAAAPSVSLPSGVYSLSPLRDQAASSGASPEIRDFVSHFLGNAVLLETQSYVEVNDWYVSLVMTGEPLQATRAAIANFASQGVIYAPQFDFTQSYFVDVRVPQASTLEVDSCEVWSGDYFNAFDGTRFASDPARLLPQTITIAVSAVEAYITRVVLYDAPAFCD
jgi:hypothetical protein